ncbi:hypothetical protein CUMW_102020 [Citrus unshiu]|uniref:Uncharacterized protein n=1 Tax=Citrus sinensis TaxID=2711 RepID=A0A067F551_CITSI|nr:hypothetical protein CISIN_1g015205mg [Citrus sinensis]GAY47093.1 hypothetical protein CUMW_102020 [Citrus unshiu]
MKRALKVEIQGREIIKPSHPTPHHLRNLELSLLDQTNYSLYVCTCFLYKVNNNVKADQVSQRLKSSLSETLTKFYPFAGRVKDDFSIECNDEGVEFIDGRADGFLSEYLQNPDQKLLTEFQPFGGKGDPIAGKGPLLILQVTFFKCGGVAITTLSSHKLIDALSSSIFISCWAAVARAESNRFVFDASKLAQLQAEVASASVPRPSRVEALTALIWKCARTASRSNRGFARPSLLVQAVNLRSVVVPPLSENSVGNSIGFMPAQTSEKEMELQELVCKLRKAKDEFSNNGIQTLLETKSILNVSESTRDKFERDEIDFFSFTSMISFPVHEGADFGWGKPIHVTFPNYTTPNVVILVSTEDGAGIEAFVYLSPEDMPIFERSQELLSFATLNPPVQVNEKEKGSFASKSSL